ncbi:30S ribosome-binding factor RbfA [Hoyosella rhizosphaerae]|uniref:Ribosome-binding factor A n=1 Tax=Hoyosella rhizosphaerae TaxID=1755582 RepID=A0A916U5D3_9ACTN|nr:30S ribosome-binding factor RbfA [Hoyosella rhizosphaerae]MBN4926295.1 30S ribosome-binding factor RbfA [Hoyosella rhizosphaerae]GGC60463.1 ribosome-binding factor A [Hoyosella rhizosphaerae]
MADSPRARRLAKRIMTIVATAIELEIKDPRLEFVTVTDARITNDLRDATVYYTVRGKDLNTAPDIEGAGLALEKAKGQLRTRVGAGTGVRFTPTLAFSLDSVPEAARHMEELLAKARAADAEVAKVRENATYAGDPDPYRQPGDSEDDSVDPDDGDEVSAETR